MVLAKVLPKGQITIMEEVEEGVLLRKGKTLFDVAGSIEIEGGVSLKTLIEEAREGEGFSSHRQ